MRRVRLAVAALVTIGACAVTGLVGAPAASAATCSWRDAAWLDSGVSSAQVALYYCFNIGGNGGWHEFRGTLWDDACDDRTAYLDIYPWDGGHFGIHAPGCGKRTPFTITTDRILGHDVELRTRACNTTCSGPDEDVLYPY